MENRENLKKNKFTFVLLIISITLVIFYFSLPSKNKVNEIEVRTIEKNIRTVDVQAYYMEGNSLKSYIFRTPEDSYSNLIVATVKDILEKSDKNSKISLENTYFSDNAIYFEFNNKNLSPELKNAIKKTTEELLGLSNINFI